MANANTLAPPEVQPALAGRWILWRTVLGILLVSGMVTAWLAQQMVHSTLPTNREETLPGSDRIDLTVPNPSLTPEQVVVMQLESLRAAVADNSRLIACYSLAAPANRAVTGPFELFSNLVRSEPYLELMTCQEFQVGTAVIEEQTAAVLVSLLTEHNQSMAFRFLLGKQSAAPYQDCWMTEGVFALTPQPLGSGDQVEDLPLGNSTIDSAPHPGDLPQRESPFD